MALVTRIADGRRFHLPARGLLGRSARATLRLDDTFASSEHARIGWNGSAWEIRDLASRNGTFVNGTPIPSGSSRALEAGDRIGFGSPEASFVFEDGSPPDAMAVDLGGGDLIRGAGQLLQLPSPDTPAITVFRGIEGGWYAEDDAGATRSVQNQDTIEVLGKPYRLELPEDSDLTPIADLAFSLRNITVRFHVPASLERIAVELVHARRQQWLEPREHHHLLYVLAKERGATRSEAEDARGWRPTGWLTKALKMDDSAVNVLIHRARHQLASAGVEGAAGIVEVKRGQRRFGTDRFEIVDDAGR
jgi:hypothetical protein